MTLLRGFTLIWEVYRSKIFMLVRRNWKSVPGVKILNFRIIKIGKTEMPLCLNFGFFFHKQDLRPKKPRFKGLNWSFVNGNPQKILVYCLAFLPVHISIFLKSEGSLRHYIMVDLVTSLYPSCYIKQSWIEILGRRRRDGWILQLATILLSGDWLGFTN